MLLQEGGFGLPFDLQLPVTFGWLSLPAWARLSLRTASATPTGETRRTLELGPLGAVVTSLKVLASIMQGMPYINVAGGC